jgi:hypothetical protein
MKSKLILLATAAMLVATNAQAGFLTPESQRCASNRPHGIYHPSDTALGNCDVAANRAAVQPVAQVGRPDETPVGAPGSLVGVPRDIISPLVPKELDAAARDTRPLPLITSNPRLLQYLPEGYFNTPEGRAAFKRLARVEPSFVNPPPAGLAHLADRLTSLSHPSAAARQQAQR